MEQNCRTFGKTVGSICGRAILIIGDVIPPVLFPIVGRVYDDIYRYRGAEYHLGQHGFARDMDFSLVGQTAGNAVFAFESSDRTLELYPCRIRLEIEYRLSGSAVEVLWRVENKDKDPMHFKSAD